MSLRPYVHLDHPLEGARSGAHVPLDPTAHHHLSRVLRLAPGAPLEVADGRGATASAVLARE
ncbi:MAG: 16S rRNA (uracil(1498)-N(3))-methyltransferase, partial [Actinomycetota bacterium]